MCVQLYVCVYAVVCVWVCSCIFVVVQCRFVCVQLYVCVCVCSYIFVYISIYSLCRYIFVCLCVCIDMRYMDMDLTKNAAFQTSPGYVIISEHWALVEIDSSVCAISWGGNMLCSQLCSMDCEKGGAELNRILYIFPLHDDRVTSMSQSSFLLNKF